MLLVLISTSLAIFGLVISLDRKLEPELKVSHMGCVG